MRLLRRGFITGLEFSPMIHVELPSRRVIWLVLFIVVCSALDALFTLLFISKGGGEANPCAALLMSYGDTTFVSVKMAITGAGAWVLAALQKFVLAYLALHGLMVLYLGLMGLHAVLWLS
jgi:hypothetical protein